MALTTGKPGAHGVDGIARVRNKRNIAGIDEAERRMADPLFGPNKRKDLGLRVQGQPESTPVPSSGGLAEGREALGLRIPVIRSVKGRLPERIDDWRRGRNVGIPKLITSTPWAFFSAILRLMPTNRYGGTFSIRFESLIQPPDVFWGYMVREGGNTGKEGFLDKS